MAHLLSRRWDLYRRLQRLFNFKGSISQAIQRSLIITNTYPALEKLIHGFIIGLALLVNWKKNSYDTIFVIADNLTKIMHYGPLKTMINIAGIAKFIINVVIRHYGLPKLIISNRNSLFTLKFWSESYYYLGIKRRLSTTFYLQTNSQIERQNSTTETYLYAFANWKQNDWAKLLPMIEFAYNNTKNLSFGHILFELNYVYYPCISFKDNTNFC